MRVLILDDSPLDMLLAVKTCELSGHEAVECDNWLEAMRLFRDVDGAMIDWNMPCIRDDVRRQGIKTLMDWNIPIVVLTGEVNAEAEVPKGVRVVRKPRVTEALEYLEECCQHPLAIETSR